MPILFLYMLSPAPPFPLCEINQWIVSALGLFSLQWLWLCLSVNPKSLLPPFMICKFGIPGTVASIQVNLYPWSCWRWGKQTDYWVLCGSRRWTGEGVLHSSPLDLVSALSDPAPSENHLHLASFHTTEGGVTVFFLVLVHQALNFSRGDCLWLASPLSVTVFVTIAQPVTVAC